MGKLNAKLVEHAKPKATEYRVADGDGLFLRVRSSGAKSWLFCFRLGSDRKWRQMPLGKLSDVSLKEAREEVSLLRKLVAQGLDPQIEKAAAKDKNIQAITMQTLFEKWMEFLKPAEKSDSDSSEIIVEKASKLRAINRYQNRWRLHLKKPLGNLLVRDVTRGHLAVALDEMKQKGIKEETRKALTTLNLMLDFGLSRQFIEQNPARLLKPKDFEATAGKPRDRTLSLTELRQLWRALDDANITCNNTDDTSKISILTLSAIKILILTGARRAEVAGMRWSEINLSDGVWLLPSVRTKNRQAHTIYLSTLAIEILKKLDSISGGSLFVFDTGRYLDGGHIHQDTLTGVIARLRGVAKGAKKKIVRHAPLIDMKPFSVHDLRRSAATAWGEYLKTEPHVIERMLNHQPLNKLVATYQRAGYVEEQHATWLAWGQMVEHQIANDFDNVVLMRDVVNS